jgi:hypothetical protein
VEKAMKRLIVLGFVAGSLFGCAEPPAPSPGAPDPASARPDHRPGPPVAGDECGARELQHLVGKPRSEIPVPVNPALQRVACTTCPVTMDFHPRRLNFFYDADTGRIKEVRCG